MLLNDNKAGMQGLDKEKINRIIFEASKGNFNIFAIIWSTFICELYRSCI